MMTSGMHRRPFEGRHLVYSYAPERVNFISIFEFAKSFDNSGEKLHIKDMYMFLFKSM